MSVHIPPISEQPEDTESVTADQQQCDFNHSE